MTNGDDRIFDNFVHFQNGSGCGFDVAWFGVQSIVEDFARRSLKKLRVKVWTGYGESAVEEVVSQTKARLLKLCQPGAKGRFDPAKARSPGLNGLKGWLWRIVQNQATDWMRQNCDCGDRKVHLASELEWNAPSVSGEPKAFFDRIPAKIERADLLPILEECINELTDPLMREAVLLKLHEGLSHKAISVRLGVAEPRIQRRLAAAWPILKTLLGDRGVDESWLAA